MFSVCGNGKNQKKYTGYQNINLGKYKGREIVYLGKMLRLGDKNGGEK